MAFENDVNNSENNQTSNVDLNESTETNITPTSSYGFSDENTNSSDNSFDENLNQPTFEEDQQKNKNRKFFSSGFLFAFLVMFGVVSITFYYIFNICLKPIMVVGLSMYPTINYSATSDDDEDHCDIVFYSKDDSYSTNNIVIINSPDNKYVLDGTSCIIKRVIATPGQTIRFFVTSVEFSEQYHDYLYYYSFEVLDENGNVIEIDNSFLSEDAKNMYFQESYVRSTKIQGYNVYYAIFSYLLNNSNTNEEIENIYYDDGSVYYVVSEGCYFVMGDNRNVSLDSRFFGEVDYEDIMGSVKIQLKYGQNLLQAIWYKIKYSI